MGDLLKLAERVEAEEPSYDLWSICGATVYPMREHPERLGKFCGLVMAGAYLDAADMLLPPNSNSSLEMNWSGKPMACANAFPIDRITGKQITLSVDGEAHEPHAKARATLACALRLHAKLRAHAAGGGNGG